MTLEHDQVEATALLAQVDARVLRQLAGLHRAIAACTGADPLAPLVAPVVVTAHELDGAISVWAQLVPTDAVLRADLVRLVLLRSGLSDGPAAEALGVGDLAVATAYATRYGTDLAADLAATPVAPPRRVVQVPGLPARRLLTLERAFTPLHLNAGQVLFEAGDPGDSLYVVSTGRVRVVVGQGSQARTVRELAAGELFGEAALLTGEPRTATIIAVRDTELHRIDSAGVEQHLFNDSVALRSVLSTLARRLQRAAPVAPGGTGIRNVAVVSAGAADERSARALADSVAAFLGHHGTRAVVVSAADCTAALGPTATDGERCDWLDGQEDRSDLLLCLVGDESGDWARQCLRQADLVLLVAAFGAVDPRPQGVEVLAPVGTRRELVLVHSSDAVPLTGTRRWLVGRSIARVHHVVLTRAEHLGRLARFVVGRPVGLALSGGSVRGFAHIGMFRALREHGIPVDVVCGTSAGSLLGAQHAMGWDDEEMVRRNTALFLTSRRRLIDWTLPVTSLLGGAQLGRTLDALFGDLQIEDLRLPFLCTTSDLTTAELLTHDSGPLRLWVRASCSVPVLLPPVVVGSHLIADGGVLNNLSVGALAAKVDLGTLLLSDVSTPFYTADEPYDYGDSLPFWRVLRSRLPGGRRLVAPGIAQVLLRTIELGTKSMEAEQIARADLYVRPAFDNASYTDTRRLPQIVQSGYQAATRALADFDASGIPFR